MIFPREATKANCSPLIIQLVEFVIKSANLCLRVFGETSELCNSRLVSTSVSDRTSIIIGPCQMITLAIVSRSTASSFSLTFSNICLSEEFSLLKIMTRTDCPDL